MGRNGTALRPEPLAGKAIKTINLIFQKIFFPEKGFLFKMNLSKEWAKGRALRFESEVKNDRKVLPVDLAD